MAVNTPDPIMPQMADKGNDAPTDTSATPMETIQRDLDIFTKNICERFRIQHSELQAVKQENLELKQQKMKQLMDIRSLNERIKKLEAELEAWKSNTSEDALHSDISADAAGDAKMRCLLEENLKLKEELKKCRPESVQPESCQASSAPEVDSSSFEEIEADCQVTEPPNTHLNYPAGPTTEKMFGKTDSGAPVVTPESASPSMERSQDVPIEEMKQLSIGSPPREKEISGSKVITTDMMMWLSENVDMNEWKPLMRKLGLKDSHLDVIIAENPRNIREQRYQGFQKWVQMYNPDANVPSLLQTMKAQSLRHLSREFCKEFQLDLNEQLSKRPPKNTAKVQSTFVPSSDFERFMQHFLPQNGFDAFMEDLKQCGRLGEHGLTPETLPVPEAFEQTCSKYYREKGLDDDLAKRQRLWQILRDYDKIEKIRDVFKKHIDQGGVIGPATMEDTKIDKLPYSKLRAVTELLSIEEGGVIANWKNLLEWLKKDYPKVFGPVTKFKIQQWEKTPLEGAKSVLSIWETTTKAEVGTLYRWAVENERMDIAKELE